ncbi:hypothetical protein QWY16_01575 [Planococcus shenhongbingii]|uniref:hypothetical protein n=1 Tax=Planococcus shenhongbingii TaxID=3058398 RepID=UPI00262231B6|nr:hypothetical protein [Planococcus sp. N016]WKA58872.1 hypothetical protein QWY16_01575 [Planococcus sp. N016]
MNKKIWIAVSLLAAALLAALIFMPRDNEPPPNTRIVLEHTYRTYIAPSCFDEADATNFLEDATLADAKELGYLPHSTCTEESLQGNNDSFFIDLMKELGIMERDSKDW